MISWIKRKEAEILVEFFSRANLRQTKITKKKKLFPYYCMIYVSIRVDGKKKFTKNILTHNQDSHVKEAA